MTKLRQLLHDLIDHAVPAGNRRGELHQAADAAIAELAPEHVPAEADPAAGEPTPPKSAPVLQVPKVKTDGAATA